jgi:hypothetical protein
MSEIQDRLMATGERLRLQATGLLAAKRYRPAEILATNAVGIFMFLSVDEGSHYDMRERADALASVCLNMAGKARSEWLSVRQSPKLQGKGASRQGVDKVVADEFDEAFEEALYIMRTVADEFR